MPRKIRPRPKEQSPIILNWFRGFSRFLTPKAYAIGFIASLLAAVLVVIAMVLLAEYTKTRGRLLLTALVLAAYFFSSLGPIWAAQRRSGSAAPRFAFVAGAAALLLLLTGIWGTPNSDAFWKSTAIVTIIGLVLAYVAVVELQQGSLTRPFAVKAVALAAIMACIGIAAGVNWPPYWWVFTLVVIVWAGALLVPTARYLKRRIQRR